MKKSGKDRLKSTIYESTLSTADAVPLPQWGRLRYENAAIPETQPGRQRGGGFAAKKEANPASLRSAAPSKGRGSRGYSLLPTEGGAPKGRRLDGVSGISVSSAFPSRGRLTIRGKPAIKRPSGIATIYTLRRLDPSTQFSCFRSYIF